MAREWTESEWQQVLEQLRADGTVDVQDMLLDGLSVERLLDGAPRVNGKPHFNRVRFHRVVFGEEADFEGVTFGSLASFEGATFGSLVTFYGATFDAEASFKAATFGDEINLSGATFRGLVSFQGATFGDDTRWDGARFGDRARFESSTFGGVTSFSRATFDAEASFKSVTFGGVPSFDGATFGGVARFEGATFGEGTRFNGVRFSSWARLAEARFGDYASFVEAAFQGPARFGQARFGDEACFADAKFSHRTSFEEATFGDGTSFEGTTFGDGTSFEGATFGDETRFERARFGDHASFAGTTLGDLASFEGATFGDGGALGPLLVTGRLVLDGATVSRPERMVISAAVISAQKIVVPFGATFLVRWAELDLEAASFPQPTIVAALGQPADPRMELAVPEDPETGRPDPLWLHPDTGELDPRPRLVSLRLANVENLVLSDVNLAACRLNGTHNLDRLRWEGSTEFAHTPRVGPRSWGRGRQVLAAEHKWRAARRHSKGWYPPACQPRKKLERDGKPLEPTKTATLYRALRKAREDAKDEPGAADFYYGEMEMRRFAAAWGAERLLLSVYWLSCGYALRAWRAFACLAALLVVGSLLFTTVGFDRSQVPVTRPDRLMPSGQLHYAKMMTPAPSATLTDGVEFAVDTSTSLLRTRSDRPLTGTGRVTELVLRFAGPLLLGLALLSLRGRVKR